VGGTGEKGCDMDTLKGLPASIIGQLKSDLPRFIKLTEDLLNFAAGYVYAAPADRSTFSLAHVDAYAQVITRFADAEGFPMDSSILELSLMIGNGENRWIEPLEETELQRAYVRASAAVQRLWCAVENLSNQPPKSDNDERDKWIYGQCCEGIAYAKIGHDLSSLARNNGWCAIDSPQALSSAAKRYANRHNLPLPPKRRD